MKTKHPANSPHYAVFDGMCWPLPSARIKDIEWKMRHDPKEVNAGDLMLAASVLAAYGELVHCSSRKRATVIQGMRDKRNELQSR